MAFLLCVANQKGGSGKTTTAMNLAGGFAKAKYPVLLIDADPQESAHIWSRARGESTLPFHVTLAGDVPHNFAQLARSSEYEVVIVDCPPGVADESGTAGNLARAAIREADAVLVPLRASTLDFSSTSSFVGYLAARRQPGQRILVLLNGQQHTLLSRQAPEQAVALFSAIPGAIVLDTAIGLRVPIAEVCGSGKTIFDYAPRSEAAREYSELTQEVIRCLTAPLSSPSPVNATL